MPLEVYRQTMFTSCRCGGSVGKVTRLHAKCIRIRASFPGRAEYFALLQKSKLVVGFTQPLVQWVAGELSLAVMRPAREAHRSLHLVPR